MKIFFLKVSHFELSSAIVTCTVSPIVFAFFFFPLLSPVVFFPLWVQRSEPETSTGIQNGEGTELGSHG
jgi:hypothetical protein